MYLRDIDKAIDASMYSFTPDQEHLMQTVPWGFIVRGETTVMDYLDFKLERLYAEE